MESLLMKDESNGDSQKEAISDFVLSWTLRVAQDNFPTRDTQPRLHTSCRQILSKLIFGLENGDKIKPTDKVISVKVWKQWNWIDLHANVELEIDGQKEFHLIVIENKAYTRTHDNQLLRYKDLINQTYDASSDIKQFKRHFILITFLDSDNKKEVYESLQKDCQENGYRCISILDLQPNCGCIDTESDIFNEFWLRVW